MAFLDNNGVTTLVTRLKTYFALKTEIPTVPTSYTSNPKMDGNASAGTVVEYARGNHVHPHDTSRVPTSTTINGKALSSNVTLSASDVGAQATLVSGTNIKTINGESLLGSGDITVGGGGGSSGLVLNIIHEQGGTTYTLDKTVSEIVQALNSGISPVFISTNDDGSKSYYPLKSVKFKSSPYSLSISCTGYDGIMFSAFGLSSYPYYTDMGGGGSN